MLTTLLSITAILAAILVGFSVLLMKPQRSLNNIYLAIGFVLMAIVEGADLLALKDPVIWQRAKSISLAFEALSGSAWLLFAVTCARKKPFQNLTPLSWILVTGALMLPVAAIWPTSTFFFFAPEFAEDHILFLSHNSYWFYMGVIFFIFVALYQLERTLVAFTAMERSMVKFEIIGIGLILITSLIYYSQALFYHTIDMHWAPARSVALLAGSGFCYYSYFRGDAIKGIRVSRTVVTQSVVVLSLGCYLFFLGGVGEILRYLGMHERMPFIGFILFSGFGLALLLLSEKNHQKIKVFLYKHFYKHKYDYRNEWLMFTEHLSSAGNMEKLQEAILDFYSKTFERESAALYLLEKESGNYKLTSGRNFEFLDFKIHTNHPLVVYLNQDNWVFNSDDHHSSQLDSVKQQFEVFKVKLCVPLKYEHDLEGFIFLGETIHKDNDLIFEDYDLMKVLARQATSVLLVLKLSTQLSNTQEMAAIGKMSTFVIHDLKNHASSLTLMVDNAKKYINNTEFQNDMLQSLDETIQKINFLIMKLKNVKEKTELNLEPCDLKKVVLNAVGASGKKPDIIQAESTRVCVDIIEIEKVVLNLISNAYEASTENSPVTVSVGMGGFMVTDQGCGMTEEFIRNRLFQPFQTTKQNGFGIGLYQCRQIIEAHGGRLEVNSKLGEGTSFKVHLPAVTS